MASPCSFSRSKTATRSGATVHEVLHHRQLPEPARRTRDHAVAVGVTGDDDDHAEVGGAPERLLVQMRDLVRPEVLVLDVDQGACAAEQLRIDASDASLAFAREGVRRSFRGIGAKDLDGVATHRGRRCSVDSDGIGDRRLLRCPRDDPREPEPAPLERRRVVPPLPEGLGQVGDGRSSHLRLDIVPGRVRPVRRIQGLRLRIAQVLGVVPAAVTEIDPADERDLLVVPARAKEDELLVVGSRATDARVQEDLGLLPG